MEFTTLSPSSSYPSPTFGHYVLPPHPPSQEQLSSSPCSLPPSYDSVIVAVLVVLVVVVDVGVDVVEK